MGTLDDATSILLVCSNVGYQRDFLANAFSNAGCYVRAVGTVTEALTHISAHGFSDLVVVEETTVRHCRNDGWKLAEELQKKGHPVVVLARQRNLAFDARWVRPNDTPENVVTEVLSILDELQAVTA